MALTRKDFFQLARDLRRIYTRLSDETDLNLLPIAQERKIKEQIKTIIQEQIIGFCQGQNSLFDSGRFLAEVNKE